MDKTRHDAWANAEAYESYVGRWSRITAKDFLKWLDVPKNKTWLDLGCGTDALSQTILEIAFPSNLLAVEPSEDFLTLAKCQINDDRALFALGSGSDIPTEDNSIDVLVSAYVLNFIPNLQEAFDEMKRVVKPGGVIAAYVWDYKDKTEFMRYFWDAASDLDDEAKELDEGKRFSLCHPDKLSPQFRFAGLQEVEVKAIDISTVYKDFDDYWQPFLGGIGPAPGYVASLSSREKERLRVKLYQSFLISDDGSIHLRARSWAVKSIV